jgi:tripartite-type tricarboxylate transporter receptor subunit TctC
MAAIAAAPNARFPFAAGALTDTLARILAQRMTVKLGQSML